MKNGNRTNKDNLSFTIPRPRFSCLKSNHEQGERGPSPAIPRKFVPFILNASEQAKKRGITEGDSFTTE